MNIGTLALIAAFACAFALAAKAIWELFAERVRCSDGQIVKLHGWQKESMALSEMARINFHYHAVVGFLSVWEFVSKSGRSLHIDGHARGMKAALLALEQHLPGFSMAQFQRRFEAGDVEDTIEVWSAKPALAFNDKM